MKRIIITLGMIVAISGVSVVYSRPTEAAIPLLQPVVNIIDGIVSGPSTTSSNATTPTQPTATTPKTATALETSAAPTQTSATGETATTAIASTPASASFLSDTPANRISSYTYPSTKLSPEITSRLNLLAAVFAAFGLFLSVGLYEVVIGLARSVTSALRRGSSIEEVR